MLALRLRPATLGPCVPTKGFVMAVNVVFAASFRGIIDHNRRLRNDLIQLDQTRKVSDYTLTCLSAETVILEDTMISLEEYCKDYKQRLRKDEGWAATEMNVILFAVSVTLADISMEMKKVKPTSQRSSRRSMLDPFRRKEDEMEPLLHQLRGCSSVLQTLFKTLDPYRKPNETSEFMRACKRKIVEHMKHVAFSRFGADSVRDQPNYVASVWPSGKTKRMLYPLMPSLLEHGLTVDESQRVYQKANNKPFIVKHTLQKWQSYGSKEDYLIALAALAKSDCDLWATDETLSLMYSYGQDLYPALLKALRIADYKLTRVVHWLSRLLYLMRYGQSEDIEDDIRCHLHKAMAVNNEYNLERMCGEFDVLRGIEPADPLPSIQRPLVDPTPTRFSPIIYLQIWEHHNYDALKARSSIDKLVARAAKIDMEWDTETALLVLRDYSFTIAWFDRELLDATADLPHTAIIARAITHCAHHYRVPDIIHTLRTLSQSMHASWRVEGLGRMAERYAYNLDAMTRIKAQLEAAFPSSFVENGLCWDWLAFNDFDLDVTVRDAGEIPVGFILYDAEFQQELVFQKRARELTGGYTYPIRLAGNLFRR